MNISVGIISKSEKINKQVLDAVSFAKEIIIVVDSKQQKSKNIGNKNIYFRPLDNDFSSQRNFLLSKCHEDWVLFVDDDEYVSTELVREIKNLKPDASVSGYLIPRVDVCFHQPLLHGETGHTKLLRLAKKESGSFARPVHETWKIKGKVGELQSPLYHIKDNFVSEFSERMAHYADIDSDILTKENKPFTYTRLFLNPPGKFLTNYFIKLGLLDGMAGLFQAYLMSIQSLTVRIFQWTKRN